MQHDNQLPELVKRKLAGPGTTLTPAESRACLVGCIQQGKGVAKLAQGKRIVVVLGNTGAGKSAFVNLLHGCTFAYEDDDKMVVRHDSPVEELMRIGHSSTSETFLPQVEDAGRCLGDGFAFVDCPGFLDNRGFEINVANAVNVRHAVATASSAVVVVVVNYYSLRADRGKGLHDLLSILLGLFGSVERIKAHAPSVMLAIAHAPVTHPETGAAMTLERYQRSLLDPSGLDETTGEVLRALLDREGSAFLFHLLGRGDDSWLTRSSCVRSWPPWAARCASCSSWALPRPTPPRPRSSWSCSS
jgi:energy-coupling factor transporter ATP-binding protein EcfA2